jgi:16S rRNA (cytosine967-C5)-methyltransferase
LQELAIWKKGVIEVQDEGAQLVSLFANVKPGDNVLDYCAGAGGKTLLMSALMKNKGRLIATDLLPWRLNQGVKRYRRAGVHNVQAKELDDTKWWKRHHNYFDCVLIDVPCSGSGTWRRNPDLKITFTQKDLKELLVKQQDILETAKKYIRPGGLFVYATCSIWRAENHDQIKKFLENNPEFSLEPIGENNPEIIKRLKTKQDAEGLQLTPLDHQTDGFFVSVMRREL